MRPLALTLSLALALAAAPGPAAAQEVPSRIVRLKSKVLGQERVLLVRTPRDYDATKRSYPVLFTTDGARLLPTLSFLVQSLAGEGLMPEMIVVGLNHEDRTNELTPTRSGFDGRELPTSGGADRFLAFLEQEVVPWVDANYRTTPYRVLAGHSFGGLFALHAMSARPALFGGWIALSPTYVWDRELPARRAAEALRASPPPRGTLFHALGDEGEALDAAYRRFEAALAAVPHPDLRVSSARLEGEDHGSVVLPGAYRGLRAVFEGWRMPVADGALGPKGGAEAVERHYAALSKRFGYAIPAPERAVNLAGYQLLQEGKVDEAIRTFRRNVELYPASANVHDSLGEAYERSGRLDLAVASYGKAVELAEKDKDPNLGIMRANLQRAAAAHLGPKT